MLLFLAACAWISQESYDERLDPDGDGFLGVTSSDEDCAPFDPTLPAAWYPDIDRDGHGVDGTPVYACVAPYGTAATTDDCDDTRADVHPGATEVCDDDDVDEDCSGAADDADPGVDPASQPYWYQDVDGDGHPGSDSVVQACEQPDGYATYADDCDDGDARVFPGNTEACGDGIDNDCDERTEADCRLDGTLDDTGATLRLTAGAADMQVGSSIALLPGDGGPGLVAIGSAEGTSAIVHLVPGDATGERSLDASGYDRTVVATTTWDRTATTVTAPGAWADWTTSGLLVGAVPGDSATVGGGPGRLWLAEVPASGELDLTDAAPIFLGVDGDGAGSIPAVPCDVDADGIVDLLVPVPDHSGGYQGQGAVWLIHGDGSGAAPAALDAATSDPIVVGDSQGDRLGASVAVADVGGDGFPDVLIGAPGHDGLADGTDASGAGIVYVLEGPLDPDLTVSGLDRNPVVKMYGEEAQLRTGTELTLAAGADVDGDGYADVAIGAPSTEGVDSYGEPWSTSGGRVYFVRGGARNLAGSLRNAPGVFLGEQDEDRLGAMVRFAGDLDGDGAPDLALGSGWYDRHRTAVTDAADGDNAGAVWVVYGPALSGTFNISDAAQLVILGAPADQLGAALTGGDADGDGIDDLLLGAPGRGGGVGGASVWRGSAP